MNREVGKLMDDREMVEHCVEVLLHQEMHAEIQEHRLSSTRPT